MSEEEFKTWMKKVDLLLEKKFGMISDDLPDINYRDEADGGVTPEEFVAELDEDSFF